ncbi:hypothetical protein PQQ52_10800 [Paraburkholderia sediminicola]|uniref:hypothetical protein n=1 Tax=Paraburkholderia sediminicola TaxID=458836 RepID=UPI0038BBA49B
MKFRKRNCTVDAIQWFKPGDHAAVEMHEGLWRVLTPEGWRAVAPGNWIVTDDGKNAFPMKNQLFINIYEPATEAD